MYLQNNSKQCSNSAYPLRQSLGFVQILFIKFVTVSQDSERSWVVGLAAVLIIILLLATQPSQKQPASSFLQSPKSQTRFCFYLCKTSRLGKIPTSSLTPIGCPAGTEPIRGLDSARETPDTPLELKLWQERWSLYFRWGDGTPSSGLLSGSNLALHISHSTGWCLVNCQTTTKYQIHIEMVPYKNIALNCQSAQCMRCSIGKKQQAACFLLSSNAWSGVMAWARLTIRCSLLTHSQFCHKFPIVISVPQFEHWTVRR